MLAGHDHSDQDDEQDIRQHTDRSGNPSGEPGRPMVDAQTHDQGEQLGDQQCPDDRHVVDA